MYVYLDHFTCIILLKVYQYAVADAEFKFQNVKKMRGGGVYMYMLLHCTCFETLEDVANIRLYIIYMYSYFSALNCSSVFITN